MGYLNALADSSYSRYSYVTFLDLADCHFDDSIFNSFKPSSIIRTVKKLSLRGCKVHVNVIEVISKFLIADGDLIDLDISGIVVVD
jgi:hypothetical protein